MQPPRRTKSRTGPAPEQAAAPLYEALQAYVNRRPVPLHVPGHKQGRGAPEEWRTLLGRGLAFDLTEAPGLDDLHAPDGPIQHAQSLAAEAFGAGRTFFLVGGTTAGIQALILAACCPGDTVLVPRHAHRSVAAAAILAGVHPAYLRPTWDAALDLPLAITPAELSAAIGRSPQARAVVLVHPTYAGHAGHLPELVRTAHAAGLAVLVDEAHGAHFRFHPDLPTTAMAAGADASVQSLHKTGGSLTQSSLLHLAPAARVDPQRVQDMLRLVQSSSPSYLLMVSLDLARRQLALHGEAAWGRTLALAAAARKRIERLSGLRCPTAAAWPGSLAAGDPTRLVVDVRGRGISGLQAATYLWERHAIAVEMATPTYLLALLAPGDGRRHIERLLQGLADLPQSGTPTVPLGEPPWPDMVLPPREGVFLPAEPIAWPAATGRLSADMISVYPPGSPVLVPGERITAAVAEYLRRARALGCHLQGLTDPHLQTIRVLKE